MRILQLSKNQPYPPTNGEETRIWRTTNQLSKIGTVWLASPWDSSVTPPAGVVVLPIDSAVLSWKIVQNDLWYGSFLFAHHPLMPVMTNLVVKTIQEINVSFDVIVSESPQLIDTAHRLAQTHSATLLLNKHNAYYQYLDQYLTDTPLPTALRRRAVRNMRQYEQQGIDLADLVVFMSEADREAFHIPSGVSTAIIPNGTDVAELQKTTDPEGLATKLNIDTSKPICVFLGSFDYDPNQAAARTIVDELAPALPDMEFLLVGRDPPNTTPGNVYTPGFVDNLADVFHIADIALCPLPRGSGTKLKMLDYLAAGLPIVTTTVGIQGLPIEDGVHALVRDDTEGMIEAITTLVGSRGLQEKLAMNAQQLGKQYDWCTLLERYEELFEEEL